MEILKPNYTWRYNPGTRRQTEYLVLHHSAGTGSAEAVHTYHRDKNNWAGIAYHYYIRLDGKIYEGRPENWNGGHTRDYNYNSIGICFEGNFDEREMPDVQIQAGRQLIADIVSRYEGIQIKLHKELNATACPGENFPLEELLKADEEPADYAREACRKAIDKGIILGNGKGVYRWTEPITRQDMCVILDRLGLL